MNERERKTLQEEFEMLKIILDFHVKHRNQTMMKDDEFENHVNDILDRMNQLKKILGI